MSKACLHICLALMLSSTAVDVLAQRTARSGDEDTLKTSILTVFRYRPTISDAKKISASPQTIDTTLPDPQIRYEMENRKYATRFVPDTIKSAKMKGEPLNPLYRNYARLGAGNGINTVADLYINSVRSRKGALGLAVNHRSNEGNLKDLPPAPFSTQTVTFSGSKFYKKSKLSASATYDRERIQYYGYDATNPFYFDVDPDAFKQLYQNIGGQVNLKSFKVDSSKTNYELGVAFDRFMSINQVTFENNAQLNTSFNRVLGQHLGKLDFDLDMNDAQYQSSIVDAATNFSGSSRLNFLADLRPTFVMQKEDWRLELGGLVQGEFFSNASEFTIYPHLYAKYNLIRSILIPYVGLTGGKQRSNFSTLTATNPFLWTELVPLRNLNETYRVYGGFRGALSKEMTFNVQAAKYRQQDAPLFVNYDASVFNPGLNRFGENYFVVEYDTLEVVEIGGELVYRKAEKIQVSASGKYFAYNTQREFEAWQRPTMEISLQGRYALANKIALTGGVFYLSPQWSKSFDAEAEEFFGVNVYGNRVKGFVDANLGLEYRYTERLSAFLRLNNLVASRYARWNQYPVQSINVLGGITFSFWKQ